MSRYTRIFVGLSVSLLLLSSYASSQTNASSLNDNDKLPSIAAPALSGKWVDMPAITAGKPAVAIFSFSRAAGREAQNWTQHLSKDDEHLAIYTVIFLESVPRLLRSMVLSEIKKDVPGVMQDRTIILYRDEREWKQRLQLTDEHRACLTLIRANGEIQWINSEPFTDARYVELRKQIRALK
jgi:hypothetical protein